MREHKELGEVKKLLKEQYGDELGDEELSNWLDSIEASRDLFPIEVEESLVIHLLKEKRQHPEKKVVVATGPIPDDPVFPIAVGIGVLSDDWPGLSDAILGIMHERGWNIYFARGFVMEGVNWGIVILAVRLETSEELLRLRGTIEEIIDSIYTSSKGSRAKVFLLAREAQKLEVFSRVAQRLEEAYPDEVEGLVGKDGEAVKFFASRSGAYIMERSVDDLIDIIMTNYRFLKAVRDSGGKIQVSVQNIKTSQGVLTGITVAGFERDISLNDCLSAIRDAVGDFRIKFSKDFTSPDSVSIYRFEITDVKDSAFSKKDREKIRKSLEKIMIKKRFERARFIESMGGFEHYMRAIIPFLLQEYKKTKVTQVYLSVSQVSEFLVEFKIIIVGPHVDTRVGFKCAEILDEVKGFTVLSTRTPKVYGEVQVDIIDLRTDLDTFSEKEHLYKTIKDSLRKVLGEFRDFDEGMRRMDADKLEMVRRAIEGVGVDLIKECYYQLEEFYRVGASVEEIIAHIDLAIQLREQLIKEKFARLIEWEL